ncbi:MAG: GAF domain-containing protein, partial [Chitinivibrionales bacterium]|nr:GAF domain-containing protein [Chitinivibrionales bacterium]
MKTTKSEVGNQPAAKFPTIRIILCTIMALTCYYLGDVWALIGIPLSLICSLLLLLLTLFRSNHSPAAAQQTQKHSRDTTYILTKPVAADNTARAIDLSVLSPDYAKAKEAEFGLLLDHLIDAAMNLIQCHLTTHTIATFLLSSDGAYHLRRHMSRSSVIDTSAVIVSGVGVIGSFLKEGCKELTLNDIVNDSSTLYYYKEDAGVRALCAAPLAIEQATIGFIIVDSTEKEFFTDARRNFLHAAASLCSQAIRHAQQSSRQQLDYERLFAVSSTEKYFFEKQSIDDALDKLVEIIPDAFKCDRLTICMLEENKPESAMVKRCIEFLPDTPGQKGIRQQSVEGSTFSLREKSLAAIVFSKNICFYRNFATD